MNRWAAGGFALAGCDVSLDNSSTPGIYQRMLTSRTKLPPMVFIQMDCTARMQPPLDDIRAAAAASPTTSSSHPLEPGPGCPGARAIPAAPWLGFDLTSCQFAVHHVRERRHVDRFIGNVAYATRLGALHRDDLDGETCELRKQVAR
jgi:hypothetical protein